MKLTRFIARILVFAAGIFPLSASHASGITVAGAGSTWSQIAVDQWRADVRTKLGLTINYQGNGSSAGRQFYVLNQVDFAVSEIPFTSNEVSQLKAAGKTYQYLPIVAGGTALMFNLKDASGRQITSLRLSPETIGKIFTGAISDWSDPAITADNGKALPAKRIVPVVRSDGSGTSAQFSAYLAKQTSTWAAFAKAQGVSAKDGTSNYPQGWGNSVAQKGSDGVANFVANTSTGGGSITYVETAYALQRGFPVAAVKNASANFTLPTPANVASALTKATLNKDRTQNLTGVYTNKSKNAYPLSSYSYMIIPTTGLNADKAKVIGQFAVYFACEGQQKAGVLGYSPLPKNLVKAVFDSVSDLQGADAPPPLDAKNCKNPTLTGDLGAGANDAGTSTGATAGGGATSGDTTTTDDSTTTDGTTTDGTTTGGTTTSGGTVVVDDTKYAQMQPVQVAITSTGFASPTLLGLAMLGVILLPVAIRLVGPHAIRFTRRLTNRIKLPALWTYKKKTPKH
jgi:phosphate transport system substrate-binding protein